AHLEEPQNPLCGRCPFTRRAREAATRIAAVEAELAELPTTPEVGAARQRAVEAVETCRRERDAALARLAALRERLAALEPVAEHAARRGALEAERAAVAEEGRALGGRAGAVGAEVARQTAGRAERAERIAA